MPYSSEYYEYLFGIPVDEIAETLPEGLGHGNVTRYRVKTITSGDVVEIEAFPIWGTRGEARAAKAQASRQAQKNQNEKNAKKNLVRKINANFGSGDLHVTLTYAGGRLPDETEARRDMRNYLRRVKAFRKKQGLPEMKYVYVIEHSDGDGRRKRVHHHVIMSGMDRSAAKSLWGKGRASADELEPEDGSLEGLARYITKQPGGIRSSKRWQASRNLVPPKVTVADRKLSVRQAERIAIDMEESAPAILGRLYKDCTFDKCTVKGSEFVSGVYIYAQMHKTPEPPAKKAARHPAMDISEGRAYGWT